MRATLRCWKYLPPPLRRRWLWLVPLGAAAALLDVLTGVALLRAVPALARTAPPPGLPLSPAWLFAGLAALLLLKTALRLAETSRREAAAEATVAAFAQLLLRFWLQAPMPRCLATPAAQRLDDIQSLANDVGREGIHSLVLFWSEGLVVAGLLALLFAAAPLPACGVLVLCGGLALLTLQVSHRRHSRWTAVLVPARIRLHAFVQGCVQSFREIRVSGRAGFFVRRFPAVRADFGDPFVSLERWKQAPLFVNEALFLLGALALVAFSRRASTASLLLLFLYAGLRLLPAVNRLVYRTIALRAAEPAAGRVDALLATAPPTAAAVPPLPPLRRAIVLADVAFTYPGRSSPALAGVSLTVRAGERLALVGPSGGGKSTLLLVLAGLLAPDRGTVRVDDAPLAADDPHWHRQLGFVGQDAFLLDGTLRENIALGEEPAHVDPAALAAAVAAAQLDEVAAALPSGLDTPIGANGCELSGGQRQRVAIARELYRRPAALLLDEATAFLDQPVEQRLVAALARARPDLTTIFVTHRLSTARTADRVAFLCAGRLEACGTFAHLAASHAGFQAFLAAARAET